MLAAASHHGFSRRVAALLCATVVVFLATATSGFADGSAVPRENRSVTRTRVSPRQVWTSTGIMLQAGETAEIRASGLTHFGAAPIDRLSPAGIPRGPQCAAADAHQQQRRVSWPAPTGDCWSLIARIGAQAPLEIGRSREIRATRAGALYLGVNDNYLGDNSGGWSATVTRTTAPPIAGVSASAKDGNASNPNRLLIAGALAAALAAVVALALLRRRARKRNAPTLGAVDGTDEVAPVEGVAAGKILEVDLSDDGTLRVEYSHFPDGTVVRWRITHGTHTERGEFATGGGSARQVATTALGSRLERLTDPAEVSFMWTVGGVAFNYAVHPNLASAPARLRPDNADDKFSGLSATS